MSLKIKLKQIDGVPTTDDLENKEIGVDIANSNLYINLDGVITSVGGGGGGSSNLVLSDTEAGTQQAVRLVDFFTAAGGLSSANTQFQFDESIDDQLVYTGTKTFTLSNGDTLESSGITLFQF